MYEQGTFSPSPVTDCVVFSKIRKILGGRVRLVITGSASIHPDVIKFLRIVLGVPIIEGYGLAETFAASFITQPGDYEAGHIGGPTPSVEAKLVDLPDIGYFSFDVNEKGEYAPRGELCLRGPTLFRGYYKDEERTHQAMDSEGWIHTGDIFVRLHHNGAFKLIDRKHGVFKLSNGEFVATGKLELAYGKSKFIDQIFVYGDPSKSHLVAVVVPDDGYVRGAWAPRLGIEREKSLQELCQIEKLRDDILTDMELISREDNLPPYEAIRKIYLESQRWTENDILTSTHKLNRKAARDKYTNILGRLYE
ncbi:unnamed protein product [Blepharisma stoltei]|uniref:AMP-dependent synthetase/ligase domain-containing protein n=1 Tax=Blepharisma stoltei TaxID=1481888 RepID=A0AAU9JER0_9CILI|nr:unnamed protein product [Blepharisma stoltei]